MEKNNFIYPESFSFWTWSKQKFSGPRPEIPKFNSYRSRPNLPCQHFSLIFNKGMAAFIPEHEQDMLTQQWNFRNRYIDFSFLIGIKWILKSVTQNCFSGSFMIFLKLFVEYLVNELVRSYSISRKGFQPLNIHWIYFSNRIDYYSVLSHAERFIISRNWILRGPIKI